METAQTIKGATQQGQNIYKIQSCMEVNEISLGIMAS